MAKELADFLNEANKSTYANKDAPKASSSRLFRSIRIGGKKNTTTATI